jgi:hypothetical protein
MLPLCGPPSPIYLLRRDGLPRAIRWRSTKMEIKANQGQSRSIKANQGNVFYFQECHSSTFSKTSACALLRRDERPPEEFPYLPVSRMRVKL